MNKKKSTVVFIVIILVGLFIYFISGQEDAYDNEVINGENSIKDQPIDGENLTDDNELFDENFSEDYIKNEDYNKNVDENEDDRNTEDDATLSDKDKEIDKNTLLDVMDENDLILATKYINNKMKYGYINRHGEFVIEAKFDYGTDFHDSVAVVSKNERYFMINKNGKVLYKDAIWLSNIHQGVINYKKEVDGEYRYGYISTSAELVTETIYKNAMDFNSSGFATVKIDNHVYVKINLSGEVLEQYDIADTYKSYIVIDDYIIYEDIETGQYGVDKLTGEVVLEPIYGQVRYLNDDMFAVVSPKLSAYEVYETVPVALYHGSGEQLTDYNLYDIKAYNGEFTSVTDSSHTYFIDKNGKMVDTLPRVKGRGSSILLRDMIKHTIDGDIFYTDKQGDVLYAMDKIQFINEDISVQENILKPNKYVTIRYPTILGLGEHEEKINEYIKNNFILYREDMKEVDGVLAEVNYSVTMKNKLLIVEMFGYEYSVGADHGMPFRELLYINRYNGNTYQLSDLFILDSNYESFIDEIIENELMKRSKGDNSHYFTDSFIGIGDERDFILLEDAIQIYFYPYEIAAYAEGFPTFHIYLDNIIEYLNVNGEFYQAFYE